MTAIKAWNGGEGEFVWAYTDSEQVENAVAQLPILEKEIRHELGRAMSLFPDSYGTMNALTEEVGELAKALMDEQLPNVRKEAIQVAVMAMRVALEGDYSLDPIRVERGQMPQRPFSYVYKNTKY